MNKKPKRKSDAVSILLEYQQNIYNNRPSMERMLDEIRMMHFKIRPVQGDISLLNLADVRLIETLWNLGKLDEFYKLKNKLFTKKEREVFFRLFDSMHAKLQKELSRIKLVTEDLINVPPVIEMEIFREEHPSKKAN